MPRSPKYAAFLAIKMGEKVWRRLILGPDLLDVQDRMKQSEKDQDKDLDEAELGSEKAGSSSQYAKLLSSFSKSLSGIYHTIFLTAHIRNNISRNYYKNRLYSFADDSLSLVKEDSDVKFFGVPSNHLHEMNRRFSDVMNFSEGISGFPSLVLLGLVAKFDSQIASFTRILLKNNNDILSNSQSEVDISTILRFDDINEVKDYLVDNEIYKLMHASHDDQVRYIEKTFSIKITDYINNYPAFLEVFERRNLVAHGEGSVNERYVNRCNAYKVPPDVRLDLNNSIYLGSDYLLEATDRLFEFGFLLFWWMWLKFEKDKCDEAYAIAIDSTFNLILDKRYALASNILKSVLSRKDKGTSEVSMRILCVNRALCNKALKNKDWRTELDRFNLDACSDNFKICIAALDEDIDGVCSLMPAVSSNTVQAASKVSPEDFRTWPAFNWVRSTEKFKNAFLKTFKQELESKPAPGSSSSAESENEVPPAPVSEMPQTLQ